ncbi:hypothetical protein L3X38_032526 [Prunus dulcis]|uniref:Uncharacterized protein n=1 Tax=Prunus dulcis TaxID=3755 RepID=A0AAD4YW45_PRUDU|nr:hypothetical protein L3X38_032526 [Prunus dulcis]
MNALPVESPATLRRQTAGPLEQAGTNGFEELGLGLRFRLVELSVSVRISSLKFWMANLAKLEFAALDLSGDNFLSWVLDAKIHLRANGLGQTIVDENNASPEENAKAMIFLRRQSMRR